MATVSFLSGLVGWILALLTICTNILVVMAAAVTLGIGGFLGICTAIMACISPLSWLIAIVTGHIAKGQIRQTGEAGGGSASAGLIMGYLGLGLILISVCILVILSLAGVAISLPILTDPSFYNNY
jgi:hypothetical protein